MEYRTCKLPKENNNNNKKYKTIYSDYPKRNIVCFQFHWYNMHTDILYWKTNKKTPLYSDYPRRNIVCFQFHCCNLHMMSFTLKTYTQNVSCVLELSTCKWLEHVYCVFRGLQLPAAEPWHVICDSCSHGNHPWRTSLCALGSEYCLFIPNLPKHRTPLKIILKIICMPAAQLVKCLCY